MATVTHRVNVVRDRFGTPDHSLDSTVVSSLRLGLTGSRFAPGNVAMNHTAE